VPTGGPVGFSAPDTDRSAAYQTAPILAYPAAVGCTPSARSAVPSAPCMSTRCTCGPLSRKASGSAALYALIRASNVGSASGVICATNTSTPGAVARM